MSIPRWLPIIAVTLVTLSIAKAAPDATSFGGNQTELLGEQLARSSVSNVQFNAGAFTLTDHAPSVREPGMAKGQAFRTGWFETPPSSVAGFDRAVVTWTANTPKGIWLKLEVRARIDGRWTARSPLALWSSDPNFWSRSYPANANADGRVNVDTLELKRFADALQVRVWLASSLPASTATAWSPSVRGLNALTFDSSMRGVATGNALRSPTWGKELPVPMRSQMIYPNSGPLKGGEVWCSPTSLTMVLEYWGNKLGQRLADPVPLATRRVWDAAYAGGGNWAFNMAYVASKGLKANVIRLGGLAQAEEWIESGVPLVLSIGWRKGELEGAPIASSQGHILVLRGFTKDGDPILNEPAQPSDARVRTVYRRAQLERLWLEHSGGIAYLILPGVQ